MGTFEIGVIWQNLLKQRALVYQNRASFRDADDYVAKRLSGKLEDQNRVSAIETQTNTAWSQVVDLLRELLMMQDEENADSLKRMDAKEVLAAARQAGLVSAAQWEKLDTIRGGRNESAHRYSFVPPLAVWDQINLVADSIDKLMGQLQAGFEKAGVKLEMDFPEFEDRGEIGSP
jgi:hypothetical protein